MPQQLCCVLFSSTWEVFHTRGRFSARQVISTMVLLLSAMESVSITLLGILSGFNAPRGINY